MERQERGAAIVEYISLASLLILIAVPSLESLYGAGGARACQSAFYLEDPNNAIFDGAGSSSPDSNGEQNSTDMGDIVDGNDHPNASNDIDDTSRDREACEELLSRYNFGGDSGEGAFEIISR
ncbi:MAG: hypothetical protein KDD64_12630 [Bdellovibrionales bacterium]|nr:hypothetical protein [Bdellovibrionales bacterium]